MILYYHFYCSWFDKDLDIYFMTAIKIFTRNKSCCALNSISWVIRVQIGCFLFQYAILTHCGLSEWSFRLFCSLQRKPSTIETWEWWFQLAEGTDTLRKLKLKMMADSPLWEWNKKHTNTFSLESLFPTFGRFYAHQQAQTVSNHLDRWFWLFI